MRIISGKYKGRIIMMPKGIRPTQNKVRKAIFDILGNIEGLSFLELFAGSAAVGLEAISRGISDLAIVEYNRDCQLAISKNIASLKLAACRVYPLEAEKAIAALHKEKRKFDIIFLDPPYSKSLFPRSCKRGSGLAATSNCGSLAKKTLQTLGAYDILAPDGLVLVQHFKKDNLPDALGDLVLFKQSRYGDTLLSFYRKSQDVPESNLSR